MYVFVGWGGEVVVVDGLFFWVCVLTHVYIRLEKCGDCYYYYSYYYFVSLAVQTGTHHVPLLTGDISTELLEELRVSSAKDVLSGRTWNKGSKHVSFCLHILCSLVLFDQHWDRFS